MDILSSIVVTIVMPCYNCAKYVSYAIESILAQSLTNFEFIIINDCSSDGSDEIIRAYLTDSRIRYIVLEKNKGNYVARNIGMKLAKGKYICVMDADDIAYPNRLKQQVLYMERNNNIGLAGSLAHSIDEMGTITGVYKKPIASSDIKLGLLLNNKFIHSSLIMRAHQVKKYHLFYDERFRYAADYALIVRASRKFKIANTSEVLVQYRIHQQQISNCKYEEQLHFANKVRLMQIRPFRTKASEKELTLHLALMELKKISETDAEAAINWFNKLLQYNQKLRLYSQKKLSDILAIILTHATGLD